MPVDFLGVVSLRDQFDGNPIFIQKFRYGFKVLRPELIRGIINAQIKMRTADEKDSIADRVKAKFGKEKEQE